VIGGRIGKGKVIPGTTLSILVTPAEIRMLTNIFILSTGDTVWALGYRVLGAAGSTTDYIFSGNVHPFKQTGVIPGFILEPNTQILARSGTFTMVVQIFGHPFYGKVISETQ